MNTTIEEQVARYSRAVTAPVTRRAAGTSPRTLREYAAAAPPPRRTRSLWAAAALFVLLLAVAAGAALIGGGSTGTNYASGVGGREQAAAATDALDQAVALVAAGQADALCRELAADVAICERLYADLDPARRPTTAPQVVGAEAIPDGELGPAYVLTVCGVDGTGAPYVTDLELVGLGDEAQAFVSPIYWSGVDLVAPTSNGDGTAGATVGSPSAAEADALPAGCPTGS